MCSFFICILGAASAGSYCQSLLFECQHYYYSRWCNSRCLSACLCRVLCLSVFLRCRASLLLSFPQFCLTAIIMCLPNAIQLEFPFSRLYFFRLDILPPFPTQSDCNGWNGESSLFLSRLSFSYCLQPKPWQCCFWLAWGKWTLWHFEPWNVAAHGITCKHCSLLPWQLMTKIQPSRTCLCQDCTQTGLSNSNMFSAIKAERLCSFLILSSSVSLSLLSAM